MFCAALQRLNKPARSTATEFGGEDDIMRTDRTTHSAQKLQPSALRRCAQFQHFKAAIPAAADRETDWRATLIQPQKATGARTGQQRNEPVACHCFGQIATDRCAK